MRIGVELIEGTGIIRRPPTDRIACTACARSSEYSCSVALTIRVDRQVLADDCRAARPRCAASARSSSSREIAPARGCTSPGGTSSPVWPSVSASGVPPTRVATVGARCHRFEQHVRERFAERRHHRDVCGREQRRHVGAQAGEQDPIRDALLDRALLQLVEVGTLTWCGLTHDEEPCVLVALFENGRRLDELFEPFSRVSLETTTTSGVPAGRPRSRRIASPSVGSLKRVRSTPFRMMTILDSSYPSPTSRS